MTYLDDYTYVSNYYDILSPTQLGLAALLGSHAAPPLTDDFAYCEVGCGHGMTSNLLAAAWPRARFVGIDLNAEHIASARAAADDAGLDNVEYHCARVEDCLELPLPPLSYIATHGVYSWVSSSTRAAVRAFVSRHLAPDGLFFVSALALPGWAPLMPFRELLRELADEREGSSLDKLQYALTRLVELRAAGARYFVETPAASRLLDSLLSTDLHYVAHDYLPETTAWRFDALADELGSAGLEIAGSLPLHLNLPDLSVRHTAHDELRRAPDRRTWERRRDLLRNAHMRRDVWCRPERELDDDAQLTALLERPVGPARAGVDQLIGSLTVDDIQLELDTPLFRRVFEVAVQGARPLGDVVEEVGAPARQVAAIAATLVALGQLTACARPSPAPLVGLELSLSRYDRVALERVLLGEGSAMAASTVVGGGVPVTAADATWLCALDAAGPGGAADWLWERLQTAGLRATLGGAVFDDREGWKAAVDGALAVFARARLPRHRALGIARAK